MELPTISLQGDTCDCDPIEPKPNNEFRFSILTSFFQETPFDVYFAFRLQHCWEGESDRYEADGLPDGRTNRRTNGETDTKNKKWFSKSTLQGPNSIL